jgi:hypothetical protein
MLNLKAETLVRTVKKTPKTIAKLTLARMASTMRKTPRIITRLTLARACTVRQTPVRTASIAMLIPVRYHHQNGYIATHHQLSMTQRHQILEAMMK